jgi:hypothetical protein
MLRFLILLTLALLIAAPAAAQSGVVWKAEYYDNPYLIGSKEYEQQESAIAFDWGLGSPRDLPDDNFSIRFTTDVYFPAGTYRFSALADDRVRVSVAYAPVINTFDKPQPGVLLSADVPLPEGVHHIQVDYREETKEAYVNVGWALLTPGSDAPQLPVLFTSAPALTPNPWQAAYFDNPNLNEPHVFKRNEPSASRTFNTDPPRPGMPADNFSVRWESIQPLDDGTYQIRVRADDGVRVYINGNRVIDEWHNATGQIYTHTFTIPKGEYRLTVEYYDNTGPGFVDFNIVLLDSRPIDQLYTLPGSGGAAQQAAPPADVPPPSGYLITAGDALNIRSGPGTNFEVIGKMPFEAQAAVLARDASNIWWMIDYNGVVGWVSQRIGRIEANANINSIPVR